MVTDGKHALIIDHLTWKAIQVARTDFVHAATRPDAPKKDRLWAERLRKMTDEEFVDWGLHEGIANFVISRDVPFAQRPPNEGAARRYVKERCDKCFFGKGIMMVAGKQVCAECLKQKFNPEVSQ